MREGPARDALIQALEIIDTVYGGIDGQKNFDVSRNGLVGRNHGPRLRGLGETLNVACVRTCAANASRSTYLDSRVSTVSLQSTP